MKIKFGTGLSKAVNPLAYLLLGLVVAPVQAQTLYVPSGTSGVGSSANGNVGVGIASPSNALHVKGPSGNDVPLLVESQTGNAYVTLKNSGGDNTLSTSGSSLYVGGSSTAGGIWFRNGWSVNMVLDTSGNLGIGTGSPTAKLDIAGGNIIAEQQLYVRHIEGKGWNDNSTVGDLYLQYTNSTYSTYINNGRLSVNGSTGNVGIGTTTPSARLDVLTSANATGRVRAFNTLHYNNNTLQIDQFGASHSSRPSWNIIGVSNAEQGLGFVTDDQAAIDAGTSLRGLFIKSGGNVGIGTTNPTQKLSVNGTIRAKEVIVDTGWSDYVFDASYRLAPLAEVERHIKAQKHLPGIPSAQEVADHGVSLGEMQSLLLAKIEELTLHQIEQEKRMQRLEGENRELRAQIQTLQTP